MTKKNQESASQKRLLSSLIAASAVTSTFAYSNVTDAEIVAKAEKLAQLVQYEPKRLQGVHNIALKPSSLAQSDDPFRDLPWSDWGDQWRDNWGDPGGEPWGETSPY